MKRQWLAKALVVTASLLFTGYVFINTYEVVFNKDIPFANSVSKFVAQSEIKAVINQFDIKPDAGPQNNAVIGRLQYLQFPALNSNLYLEERRVINGTWYVRPNLAHYIGLDKDNNGVILDFLIYADSSWRTIAQPNQIEIGTDVNLFHDDHEMASYRVAEKQVLPIQSVFIASKTQARQIILIIEDTQHAVYYGFSLVEKD